MNIGIVVPGGVDRSGERRVIPALLALIERLARTHDVRVFSLYAGGDPYELLGAEVIPVNFRRGRVGAVRRLLRAHRDQAFDVLHAIWAGPSGALATVVGRVIRRPTAVHVFGGELIAIPEIAYGGQLTWKRRLVTRVALRGATLVTASCPAIVDECQSYGVLARQVIVGPDLQRWPVRAPVRRETGSTGRIVHVASLNRIKDQETLLRAGAHLAGWGVDFHLDVVGEDTLKGAMADLADHLGLTDRVTFHGFRTHAETYPLVARAHLLGLSSRHEGGELVTLEAAAVGVPAVGTRVGHVAWLEPKAAIGVPVGDHEALAGGFRRLLENEDLRLQLATRAQERVVPHGADWTAKRFVEIYDQLSADRLAPEEPGGPSVG